MEIDKLIHVVGEADAGKPAVIRFFGPVNQENAERFNSEFLWLQEAIKPSKIVVLINSEGGSVIWGMSVFSVIHACPIEVDCVIEGIAASMGSIIWTAGTNSYMHDYSILMIHNPFLKNRDDVSEAERDTVNAFKSQMTTIYKKRFGFSKEKVSAIMSGEEGADGTYFTATEAVKAGIIPSENIIKTTKQACNKVKAAIDNGMDMDEMRNIFNEIAAEVDENKLPEVISAIHNQNKQDKSEKQMNEKELSFSAIAAQLGFEESTPTTKVAGRVSELLNMEARLQGVQAKFDELNIKYQGKEAELINVQSKLSEVEGQLQTYKDAEQAARNASINTMVDAAIQAGKIKAESKQSWINMANANLELTQSTLDSIPAREKLSEAIASDKDNQESIKNTVTEVEAAVQAKVKDVVGNIDLKKF